MTAVSYGSSPNIDVYTALAFNPNAVDLAAGGTVTWTFGGVTHNVTFDAKAGAPPKIPNTSNANGTATFTSAGTFNYHCTIHPFMTGAVTVH